MKAYSYLTSLRSWGVVTAVLLCSCSPQPTGSSPAPAHQVQLAAFVSDGDARFPERGQAGIQAFEDLVGQQLASVMWYLSWDDPFPSRDVEVVRRHGAVPHLTWELYWPSRDPQNAREVAMSDTGLDDVLRGRYDAYLDGFARAGAAYGEPVFIRFLHEFNGNWYTWSGNKNGRERGGPAKVRAVWRHVVERCRLQGASNFIWVWCPHGASIDVADEPWNRLAEYWPGADTVDWFGIDVYNWYPRDPWGGERPYRDPATFLDPVLDECLSLARLPVMIAETGTGEFTQGRVDKAGWVGGLFDELSRRPAVRMLVWFHVKKELDWRINSSPAALEAFREGVQQPWVTGEPEVRPQL